VPALPLGYSRLEGIGAIDCPAPGGLGTTVIRVRSRRAPT